MHACGALTMCTELVLPETVSYTLSAAGHPVKLQIQANPALMLCSVPACRAMG